MTNAEKIKNVQARVGNDKLATDDLIAIYLDDAKDAILKQRYPFGVPSYVTDVPEKYEVIQCKLAQRYFLRQSIEGQSVSIENGIHKHFATVDDEDLLKQVLQVAKVG